MSYRDRSFIRRFWLPILLTTFAVGWTAVSLAANRAPQIGPPGQPLDGPISRYNAAYLDCTSTVGKSIGRLASAGLVEGQPVLEQLQAELGFDSPEFQIVYELGTWHLRRLYVESSESAIGELGPAIQEKCSEVYGGLYGGTEGFSNSDPPEVDRETAPSYESVSEILEALGSAGIECTDVDSNMDNTEGQVQRLELLIDSASCSYGDSHVGVDIYKESEDLVQWMNEVRSEVGGAIPADGVPNLVVHGDAWVVVIDSAELWDAIHDALGGQRECLAECDSLDY